MLHILAHVISFKTYNNLIIILIFLENILNKQLISKGSSDYRMSEYLFIYLSSPKDMFDFRGRGREAGEREREKHGPMASNVNCNQGSNPQT